MECGYGTDFIAGERLPENHPGFPILQHVTHSPNTLAAGGN